MTKTRDTIPHMREMLVPTPDMVELREAYRALHEELASARDLDAITAVLARWESMRRRVSTWRSLAMVRFRQDTASPKAKQERELADKLSAELTELETNWKRAMLAHDAREAMVQVAGTHTLARWETSIATYKPAIADDFVLEKELNARYTELLASARIDYEGETLNLMGLDRIAESKDRDARKRAVTAQWSWFAESGEEFDTLFDDLVKVRTRMARTLGFGDFTALGYRRMVRIGYDQSHVERFRDEVRTKVVPVCAELRARQASELGVDVLQFWDEPVYMPAGDPAPLGDVAWIEAQSQEIFDALHPDIGTFFGMMRARGLLDLPTRDAKAAGGFCSSLPQWGVPFIFANFNGTRRDVRTLLHEVGHALQYWMCREQPLMEQMNPTLELAEVHSMSMEFLGWPQMERVFGDAAAAWRRLHLADSLCFLPYGVAIDHFQHLVYATPDATPAERRAMWQEMEATYLPWRSYDGLPWLSQGGVWQRQRHVFIYPFYYIDYTLALTCALQVWAQAQNDHESALQNYLAICRRGGSAPFDEVVRGAGLHSPFAQGSLTNVVAEARRVLGL